jgi:hypothetical protein
VDTNNSAKTEPRPLRFEAVEALAANQRGQSWSWAATTGLPASFSHGISTADPGSANVAIHPTGTSPVTRSSSTQESGPQCGSEPRVTSGTLNRLVFTPKQPAEHSVPQRAKLIVRSSEQSAKECHPSDTGAGRRWIVRFLAFCCIGLIPWTIGLALTLPRTYVVKNWPFAWTGFDLMLLTCLGTTAWSLWKQRQIAIPVSMITSVLLLCDAWFDILTAHGGHCLMVSIGTAIFAELPIAILLGLISVRLLHASWTPYRGVGSRSPSRSLWSTPLTTPLIVKRNRTLPDAGTASTVGVTSQLEARPMARPTVASSTTDARPLVHTNR